MTNEPNDSQLPAESDEEEDRAILGPYTQRVVDVASSNAPQTNRRILAGQLLEAFIHEGAFKDLDIPDDEPQNFALRPEDERKLQGQCTRALYITGEKLLGLGVIDPDYSIDDVQQAAGLLATAITLAVPMNYKGFERSRAFYLYDSDTERMGQEEYCIVFPFETNLDEDSHDPDPLVERDNADNMILGDLTTSRESIIAALDYVEEQIAREKNLMSGGRD